LLEFLSILQKLLVGIELAVLLATNLFLIWLLLKELQYFVVQTQVTVFSYFILILCLSKIF